MEGVILALSRVEMERTQSTQHAGGSEEQVVAQVGAIGSLFITVKHKLLEILCHGCCWRSVWEF